MTTAEVRTEADTAATTTLERGRSRLAPRHGDEPSGAVEISRRPNPLQRMANVWRYRELLVNLTRKELKVKYKTSVLGFLWTLLNPIMYLVIFSIVFGVIFQSGIHNFALYMMAGLLPWNFFVTSLTGGTIAITGQSALVTKVWFPREVLALATVGANLVHFFLQALVLLAALLVFRQVPSASYSVLLLPAMVDMLLLSAALAIAFSAFNVYLRDMTHLVELLTMAWFWLTPIVYGSPQVLQKVREHFSHPDIVILLNPVAPIVLAFQRVLFNSQFGDKPPAALPDSSFWWYLRNLGIVMALSAVLLWIALMWFSRLEDNLAEEI